MAKMETLNQLDSPEKNGIVTEEELLQRGVIYDRRRFGEILRGIFEAYRNTEESGIRNVSANGRTIPRGTSLVEETKIRVIKNINVIGKIINSNEDVASLLALSREPRYEISHIILTSDKGEVLAHRAYTSGLPGAVASRPKEIIDYLINQIKSFNPKEAWISHNHPSGSSTPSFEDFITANKSNEFFNKLNISFQGSVILGDESFSILNSSGQHYQKELELLQRGVIYDRRRIKEDLRRISETHKQTAKTEDRMALENKASIPRGTNFVEESRIRKTKSINNI